MSAAPRLCDYLDHMLEAAQLGAGYVHGLDKAEFLADRRTQQAVLMNLVIVGEAASRLLVAHATFLDRHPDVPWRTLRAMRNRVAHGYFEINLDLIWEMAKVELPELAARLPAVQTAAGNGPPPSDSEPAGADG